MLPELKRTGPKKKKKKKKKNLYLFVRGQKCNFFIAKMKAEDSSETLINIYQAARNHIPEYSYLQY